MSTNLYEQYEDLSAPDVVEACGANLLNMIASYRKKQEMHKAWVEDRQVTVMKYDNQGHATDQKGRRRMLCYGSFDTFMFGCKACPEHDSCIPDTVHGFQRLREKNGEYVEDWL